MNRLPSSIAASFDGKLRIAYPPTSSLASLKGPSVKVTFPLAALTFPPIALGMSPPASTSSPPTRGNSAVSLSIAASSLGGGGPKVFSSPFTSIMNRIGLSPR
jgi:hypothetical protein